MTQTNAQPPHSPTPNRPTSFTKEQIGWAPWLPPLEESELTDRHWAGLTEASRAKSPYFMLLARDPDILGARTRTDNDIFYNPDAGLPRGERELAAAATSRFNGCIFCASVHARFASTYTKRGDDVQRLLDDGTATDLGARWNALVSAAVALTATPPRFGSTEISALRDAGLDDLAIADLVQSTAFFNWANRLMLSLGEPTPAT
jgi:alkylhydroperoxidase domain protein